MELKEFLQLKFDKNNFIEFISDRFYGFLVNLVESEYLGKVKLDDKSEIGFFVFKEDEQKDIENSRVGFHKELRDYADKHSLDGAIGAFFNLTCKAWRLSFIRFSYDDNHKKVYTHQKRFTFVLGIDAINTPLSAFDKIHKYKNLDEIQNDFSVEAVTKAFFEEYRKLFESLNMALQSQRALFINDEMLHAFSKKLLGRLVFIYFLQKKGWLGVAENEPWGKGDKHFLCHLFEKGSFDFYAKVLMPLFFDTLNLKRENDYSSLFTCKIPFLNGGLFDKKEYDDKVFLDNAIFGEIFDVFNRYNFTIIEDSPDESEIAIDPEMLGRVFENLLEENYRKGKGAFYTPREIVSYMCKSSVEHYLEHATKEHQYLFGVDEFLELTRMSDEAIGDFYRKHPQKYVVISDYFKEIKAYKNLVVNFRVVAKLRGFIKQNDALVKTATYDGHREVDVEVWQKVLKKEYIYHSHVIGSNKEIRLSDQVFTYPTLVKYIQIDESFFALAFLPNLFGDLELNTIFPVRKRNIKGKTAQQEKIFESWNHENFAFNKKVLEALKSLWRDCHSPHTVPHENGEHNTASRFSEISHKLFNVDSLTTKSLKTHLSINWYNLKINKILNNSTIPQNDLSDIMLSRLKQIKVLDPAIGSGAFPMGMLQTIVQTRLHLGDKTPYAKLKREIIEDSIYGVDIDADAVEIAKLRFWLSLTVDETTPSPLPNLDFKIMQGNSLIETINGFAIIPPDIYDKTIKKQTNLFGTLTEQTLFDDKIFDKLTLKIHEFYNDTTGSKKQSDKVEIKNLVRELIKNYFNVQEKSYKANEINLSLFQSKKTKLANDMMSTMKNIQMAHIVLAELIKNNFQTKELFLYKLFFGEVLREGGFDVVIGNPPYIRQEKIKDLKPKLQIEGYESFNGTADIYIYFFEQGYKLLKKGGVLNFITSNKYARAKYGQAFREFVLKNTNILEYIDFNGVKVFESATVDTSILSFQKTRKEAHKFLYCDITAEYQKGENLTAFCDKNGFDYAQSDLCCESFAFANAKELTIKKRIEAIGTPLKEWDINIYRGILTGFNEAFIIDSKKREELIAKDPKSAEIIKPMLRGRDIKRYGYVWAELWLINTHNNPPVILDNYPAIKEHLTIFYSQLQKRLDKGVTPYNLRNCAYLEEFEKEKIVYPEFSSENCFVYDKNLHYTSDTAWIITDGSKYMIACLNSKTIWFYLKSIVASLGEASFRMKKIYLDLLPIPKVSLEVQKPFEVLVDTIIECKARNEDTSKLEKQIDAMVYALYGLNEEDIIVIEKSVRGNER